MPTFLFGPLNTGQTTGGAGVSTANATSTVVLKGRVSAAYVQYNGSPPAGTTDLTIATLGTSPSPPANTILTITDAATDGWFYPRHQIHDEAGAGVTYDGTNEVYEAPPIFDKVKVTIAQANDADSADVWLLLE
jgi:hypothetical protein